MVVAKLAEDPGLNPVKVHFMKYLFPKEHILRKRSREWPLLKSVFHCWHLNVSLCSHGQCVTDTTNAEIPLLCMRLKGS